MLLKDYIKNIDKKFYKISFSGIACNSSKVKKGNIFFAIVGNKVDGNKYINQAIRNGAKVIISEKKIKKKKSNIVYLYSSNVRKLLADISYKILKKRPKKFIAVTGTNGKSSIVDFYYQILDLNSKKVASIGTIGVRSRQRKKTVVNTTLDPIKLASELKILLQKKTDFIIMEASSHGLKQNRLDGLLFDVGIFTNLSHDHLDYHKNLQDYLNSKLYLFRKLIKKKGNIITDANIPQTQLIKNISLKKDINLNLIFSKKNGIQLISHKFINEKQHLEIYFKNKIYKIELNLIGKLQIKNLLMSVLAAYKSGLNFEKIINVLNKVKSVNGRFQKIGSIYNNSKVILDYAHTPAALELALLSIKEHFPTSKINVIFGCGGNRDFKKRAIMGSVAEKYANKIYLTDDNPRYENPSKIRQDIKKGIKQSKVYEIPDRRKAIHKAIISLNTGELLLVAGKGHEKTQDYGTRKLFFSDHKVILDSIKIKNNYLSKNLKLNIINELSKADISNQKLINKISINSKDIKKGDIFFAIKGKSIDGNKFVGEALNKKSSLAVVTRINKSHPQSKQIKVKNTLEFLTQCSSILRDNVKTKIVSITGSCGKTTLKEMIGLTLKKISKTTFSPKSFNNKYGVPISLINLNPKDDFGIFEVGMDKKGEIDDLTKIIKPDLGIITNISYAHSKNFKNIKQIAYAKAEIMNNIKKNGAIVLNMDDKFYSILKKIAHEKKLKVISFSVNKKNSNVKLLKLKKMRDKYELKINVNGNKINFNTKNINESNLRNILATISVIDYFRDVKNLNKNIFLDFKIPDGRGDISKINYKGKKFFLIDETYNSNPLSLKTAIMNYDQIKLDNYKKYLILGDMLELGKHSIKQHRLISKFINKSNIDKVYVLGKYIKETYKGIKLNKKAKILNNKLDIINLIKNNLNNNDYLMIKGSNSTGLHKIINVLKNQKSYAI